MRNSYFTIAVIAAAAAFSGCSPRQAPLAGPLKLKIDHHIQFELPHESQFQGFAQNLALTLHMDAPVSLPSEVEALDAHLVRFEFMEPAALREMQFTLNGWPERYPHFSPSIALSESIPLQLVVDPMGHIEKAMPRVSQEGVIADPLPGDARALLLEGTTEGPGQSHEVEAIIRHFRERWQRSLGPEGLGSLIDSHLAFPEPEGGWRPGSECTWETMRAGTCQFDGTITATVRRIDRGRAFVSINGVCERKNLGNPHMLPPGLVEFTYEATATGWAWVDIRTRRIANYILVLEGDGTLLPLMQRFAESIPFTFRASTHAAIEPNAPNDPKEPAPSQSPTPATHQNGA